MKKLVAMVSLYESGVWLENRLNNLLQSTLGNELEIWCLNANSPDPLDEEIPKRYGARIRYLRVPERIGVYAAWNCIIKESHSQYLTNANTDDIVAPNCYEKLTDTLDKLGSQFGFAYPSWHITQLANQQWPPQQAGQDRPGHYKGDVGVAGVGHFPLWRRKLHDRLGLFDEQFKALGDCDWWARCYYQGKARFQWVDQPLACYLWRDGQNLWHRVVSTEEWAVYHAKVNEYKRHA